MRTLEHAANVAVLLHAHLDDGLDPVELHRAVFEVAGLARLVERAADSSGNLDDHNFQRSGLVARDLLHAAVEFDFFTSAREEHVAGLLYGIAELANTLVAELAPFASTASLEDCTAGLTEALVLLHRGALVRDVQLERAADALLVPLARRLLGLSSCGLGVRGRDTRRAVLDLIATMHTLPDLSPGPSANPSGLIVAAAVVLGHLHALQARIAAGGAAPLIFAPLAQETPDAPVV